MCRGLCLTDFCLGYRHQNELAHTTDLAVLPVPLGCHIFLMSYSYLSCCYREPHMGLCVLADSKHAEISEPHMGLPLPGWRSKGLLDLPRWSFKRWSQNRGSHEALRSVGQVAVLHRKKGVLQHMTPLRNLVHASSASSLIYLQVLDPDLAHPVQNCGYVYSSPGQASWSNYAG